MLEKTLSLIRQIAPGPLDEGARVLNQSAETPREILFWLLARGIRILIIVGMVYVFIRLMRAVSRKIVLYAEDDDHTTQSEQEKRAATLAQVINAASRIFGITIGVFMVLRELGLNITPLLTGAGIAGVAIGFGAQSVVRDFFSGFFILMENQFRVGDVIRIDAHEGLVEQITLRTTLLRDVEGALHIIPNGEIKSVCNLTHGWSQVKLDVGVAYDEDVERVMAILRTVGKGMAADPAFGKLLLDTPQVLGIQDFGASQVTLRVLTRTLPQKQWEIARELRLRIKQAFHAAGVEVPQPARLVVAGPIGQGTVPQAGPPAGQSG